MFSSVSNHTDRMPHATMTRDQHNVFDSSTTALLCLIVLMAFGLGYFLGDKRHNRDDRTVQSQDISPAMTGTVNGRFGRMSASSLAK